jgi:hypothetical protein
MKLLISTGLISIVLASLGGEADGFSISTTTSSSSRTSTRLHMAVWSDSKAVREYQDFLASGEQEIKLTPDGPSVIIRPMEGTNVMTEALLTMGMGDDVVMTPDQDLPLTMGGKSEFPIYIALPPGQIDSFIRNLSKNLEARNQDFIFFAGGPVYGNIEGTLKDYGYCQDSMTQVLISGLKVTSGGAVMDLSTRIGTDAMGEEKWAGECASCGKWKGSVAQRLEKSAIRCTVNFYRDWRRKMWERNIMDATVNLVGAVRAQRTTQSEVALYYEEEVSDMMWEISQSLRSHKAVTLLYGFEERIFGVAENTGSEIPCTIDEEMFKFIWGNRVFTDSKTFLNYLWLAKDDCGLIPTVELPIRRENTGMMRSGNLRADGKI